MTIDSASSRYRGLQAYSAPDRTGEQHPTLPARPLPPAPASTPYLHTVVLGETLELLAQQYLGSSALWWRIADLNPTVFPTDVPPGSVLAIPTGTAPGLITRPRTF